MLRIDKLDKKEREFVIEKVKNDKDFRIRYCAHDFKMFCAYYFGTMMTHGIPDFHEAYYDANQSNKNVCSIGFRGCAKTAVFGLMGIVYDIVYKRESFLVFLAYNKADASGKLRNIITALKTNKKLTDDFGFLFEDANSGKKDLTKMQESKSVSKFITTNSIRVEAFSMDQGARGFVFYDDEGNFVRPSKVVADDVAVLKNSRNRQIVEKDFKFLMEELLGGVKGRIIFLLNAISEYCLTELLKKQFKDDPNWIFHEQPIMYDDGRLAWPKKYVMKEADAMAYNEGKPKSKWVESIEMLKGRGLKSFNCNYMNIPEVAVGDPVFDSDALEKVKVLKPIRKHVLQVNKKRFTLFVFSEEKIVSMGVDVANGGGNDNSSITGVDRNGGLVFQGASNEIEPYELAHLVKAIHYNLKYSIFKNALVIEKNNSGIAVIQELRHDKFLYRLIYRKRTEGKIEDMATNEVGFATTASSKEIIKGELDKKIENGTIPMSEEELYEFRRYVYSETGAMEAAAGSKDDRVISRGLSLMGLLYKKD